MYHLLIIDDEDMYFYSQGEEVKIYTTLEEVMEEIKELQKMEEKLFNNIQVKYKAVKIDG